MDAVAVECVVARRVLATLDGGRPMLRAALDAASARFSGARFPTYSPRQGDAMAKAHQNSLSGGYSHLIAESFNSSLAHKKRL